MPLKIGSKVKIKVAQENREWGYNPAPDGTECEVVGFGEIPWGRNSGHKPGIYLNDSWPEVRLPDGKVISISVCHIESDERGYVPMEERWLRDLPETPFYEGDAVKVNYPINSASNHPLGNDVYIVAGIDYDYLDKKRLNGTPMPAYRITDQRGGWHMAFEDTLLTLVERGNFWKYFHGEKPVFASLEEEAKFARQIGAYEEIRNPKNELYSWELEEVLEAIKSGQAHGFSANRGLFGGFGSGKIYHEVVRFKDEDLGKRVAEATLNGFAK